MPIYIERGKSILRCLLLATFLCRINFRHTSKSKAIRRKKPASRLCLKYSARKETISNTRKSRPVKPARAASPLVEIFAVEEKKERVAQFCCERS